MAPSSRYSNVGQMVEYIPDNATAIALPNLDGVANDSHPISLLTPVSPTKARQRAVDGPSPVPPKVREAAYYFTVDDQLYYNAFHHDFGPFHIGHLYRFALLFHDVLGAKENQRRPIVFWSRADPRSRANAACLLACYMVLIQSWPPHLALAPIAQVEPPLMPFRDAGYSQADYSITVQDVVYGVWKAKEEGCCALDNFDLDEYERFERVEHGDFNWVTPDFLAFASPQHSPIGRISEESDAFEKIPRTLAAVDADPTLPQSFKNVLRHFSDRKIGLVVRLNSPLYSASYFEAIGIQHLDMIFEDGTCPPLSTVRKFIRLAHETITVKKKGIAVHCKAGLGRTGCLIGAYLIYRNGFTANEIISFMRFMRPGMVVGPQQHWLHLNQGTFREWRVEERLEARLREKYGPAPVPTTPSRAKQRAAAYAAMGKSTPPRRSVSGRRPLAAVEPDNNSTVGVHDDYLPAPTPGQPRKTSRHHPYQRKAVQQSTKTTTMTEEEEEDQAEGADGETEEVVSLRRQSINGGETEEEVHLRMRSQAKTTSSRSQSHSPDRDDRSTSVSRTRTTTTTTVYEVISNDSSLDAENVGSGRSCKVSEQQQSQQPQASPTRAVRSPARSSSASGLLMNKVRGGTGSGSGSGSGSGTGATGSGKRPVVGADAGRFKDGAGVRKTSGRVGSLNTTPVSAASVRKVSAA